MEAANTTEAELTQQEREVWLPLAQDNMMRFGQLSKEIRDKMTEEHKKMTEGDQTIKAEREAELAEDFAIADNDNDGLLNLKEMGNFHIL